MGRRVLVVVGWAAGLLLGQAGEAGTVDHGVLDSLLGEHVHDDLVDYVALGRDDRLDEYVSRMSSVDPGALNEKERLAFWINLYNAYTLKVVIDNGIPSSIRDIEAPSRNGRPGNAWQTPIVAVGDRRYTLDEVEHEIIRPEFHEPRVHFALICAARGCPPLRAEAYTAARLADQLESQALRFLHGSARGCRVDPPNATVWVSEIFHWYREDFGEDNAAIGRFIAPYLPESLERRVLERGRFELRTIPFDWSLNDVRAVASSGR